MTHLEKILDKYNFPRRAPGKETAFEEIEALIGFRLPEDYKFFLNHYQENECFIGPEYLRLWDIDGLLNNNNGYQIFTYLSDTLAIGTNMGGECIAIESFDQNKLRIVLSDFTGLDKEYFIEIGASFTDMLDRLDNGREWF